MKTRLKGRRSQRDVCVQRRVQLERLWLTRKVPKAEQGPFRTPLLGDGQFVTADVERRAFPAIRRLHLNQARASVRREAGDIVASTIAILFPDPSDLTRKVVAAR